MRRSKRTWIWLILLAIIAAAALSAALFQVDYNGHAYFVNLYSPDILHIPSCPCRQASPAASGTERP